MEIIEKPTNERQAENNRPRVGFVHNCYTTPLGRLFQQTCKFGMEKAVGKAWDVLLRYRADGNAEKIREGKKDPDKVFLYDDPLFNLLDKTLKQTAREYLTDNDSERKQKIVCQAIDLVLMLGFEDVYYRPLLKKELAAIVIALADHPEYLDYDQPELMTDAVHNRFKEHIGNRQQTYQAFYKTMARIETEMKQERDQESIK